MDSGHFAALTNKPVRYKSLKVMRTTLITFLLVIILIFGCGEKQPIDEWTGQAGKRYKILDIGKLNIPQHDMVIFRVQYLSDNLGNEKLLYGEFKELYQIIALKFNFDGYTHVGLEALPILLPKFGTAEYEVYRHNVPVKNLLDYREKVKNSHL